MALFFLMIGLELKREFLEGHLKKISSIILPGIGALGGLLFPILIYLGFTYDQGYAIKGWAIPAATDIAFAVGILAFLGNRIATGLKVYLLTLAIFDDIAAILIIAFFYTSTFSLAWFAGAFLPLLCLLYLNYRGITKISAYIVLGFPLWLCFLKCGVHPSIAGIILAFFVPITHASHVHSPLKKLEKNLHSWSSFFILPVFAFFNAGVDLSGFSLSLLSSPVVLGITCGLFFGKQAGVMLFSYIALKLKICHLPCHANWRNFYGVALVTGVGFTMSLFIGGLSFGQEPYLSNMRLGVLMGSMLSGIIGYLVLRFVKQMPSARN